MNNFEIKLDKTSKVKLYHQLYLFFVNAIKNKELPEETKLPSIRTLSEDYNISRNTVTKAYSELEANGYIYSLSKSGFFVKNPSSTEPSLHSKEKSEDEGIPTVESIIKERKKEKTEEKNDFVTENIDADSSVLKNSGTFILTDPFSSEQEEQNSVLKLPSENNEKTILTNTGDLVNSSPEKRKILSPIEDYVESAKTAIKENKNLLEGNKIPDLTGEEPLRIAIAAFLYKFHHLEVNPSQVVVSCNKADILFKLLLLDEFKNPKSSLHGLLQLAEKSISPRKIKPCIAVPQGFHSSLTDVFSAASIKTTEIPFDSKESIAALLEKSGATSAFIYSKNTDSKQKKQEILEWAAKEDFRYIIEYDTSTEISGSDFVYSQDFNGKCIYIENFSNLISKSINTTAAILPKKILESYKNQYQKFGCPLSILSQMSIADFLIKDKLINYLSSIEQI
ncbi:GntR family transcriptional regulator [Treponema succinifaciens]|uniref:GntR family transcriptional regulator n=2 Tax=Treponema succinifaciens TaxID=167 RepID=UPI0003151F21|nr:GntR family transcriptional regulator [Treponema succinifaciens]MDY2616379.1 GntR family transcriptional regulator [Treponema succinifaciens]UKI55713.1 MAG: GntR family transcriptional regulator [Treponema succinifaciens]